MKNIIQCLVTLIFFNLMFICSLVGFYCFISFTFKCEFLLFFSSFLTCLSSFILPLYYLLQENQRMQQHIDSITKEVFDLQETINWKDKKIGVGNKYGGRIVLLSRLIPLLLPRNAVYSKEMKATPNLNI